MARDQIVASIEAGTNTFFVIDPRTGRRADIAVVRQAGKVPFLRTHADGDWNDNLLSLPQCPWAAKGLHNAVAFSPHGKTMALYAPQADPKTHTYVNTIALLGTDASAKAPPRYIITDPRCGIGFIAPGPAAWGGFHFTPDGKAIAILMEEKGVDNIWIQPIDGSKGHQLTHFDSLQIQDFRWSPDGKHLGVIRSEYAGDVILVRDTGGSPGQN